MRAGKIRHRITIYKQTSGRSPTGAVLPPTWTATMKLWASFEPLSVKDILAAQAAGSETVARCMVRYRTDIDSTMQVEHNGQLYDINGAPMPDAKTGREYMTLMLKSIDV